MDDAGRIGVRERDSKFREAIADELADVANIVFLLSEHTGIDLSDAIRAKMAKNEIKYPAPAKPPGETAS